MVGGDALRSAGRTKVGALVVKVVVVFAVWPSGRPG
jgi:hypothetical protein